MSQLHSWRLGFGLLAASTCWACSTEQAPHDFAEEAVEPVQQPSQQREASWGPTGKASISPVVHHLHWQRDVTLHPRGRERVATGPNAIALSPDGSVLLLDQLAGRVLQLMPNGQQQAIADVPVDSQDLASNAKGRFVTYSPVRAKAWAFGRDGKQIGEVAVTRHLRELLHIELGKDDTIWGRTAYQERFLLGTTRKGATLGTTLKSKREGAFAVAAGSSIDTIVEGGRAVVRRLAPPVAGRRSKLTARITLPQSASASRIIGTWSTIACLRTEHVSGQAPITVTRRLTCLNVEDGSLLLDENLGSPGLYSPHRELAMNGAMVAYLSPRDETLTVKRWRISK